MDIEILKGVMGKDHVHLHISYAPKLSVSEIVRRLKGRTSRKLQQEFGEIKRWYYKGHLWGIGYGVWSTGNITQKMVDEYLEHHEQGKELGQDFIME